MRKQLLLSVFLLSVIFLHAQPVLNYVRPPYGTQKTYGLYQGSMTDPAVGANQVWDYSSLKVSNFGAGIYTDPNTLPASAKNKFPTATYVEFWTVPMAPTPEQSIIDYYLETADSTQALGQQSSGGNNFSVWGYVTGVWGISYGESKMARTQNVNTGKLELTSFKYAGYGTLKTANGTYSDVAMIKNGTHVYFYQTTPYCKMLMNMLYSGPSTIAGAYIYSYIETTGNNQLTENEMKVYPNPSSGKLTIELDNTAGSSSTIMLFNESGQSVFQNQTKNPTNQIDLSNNLKGIYILKITSSEKTTSRKIVLK